MRFRALGAVPVVVLLLGLAGCGGDEGTGDTGSGGDSSSTAASNGAGGQATDASGTCSYPEDGTEAARKVDLPPSEPTESGDVEVTMSTSIGDLDLTLDAKRAPCTVNAFVSRATQKFYDNTICHRMTTKPSTIFVLQCGDPQGDGFGGPGYTSEDELKGEETYGPGVLAMANTGQPDTNGSQFFIVYDDTPLPAQYTIFGSVSADGVKRIVDLAKSGTKPPGDGKPNTPVDVSKVTVGKSGR